MNEAEMSRYITDNFQGVDVVVDSENSFFFYNPDPDAVDHMFPFVTLMTNDINDAFSNLNRPSVYRLNIGVSKETFRSLFGGPEAPSSDDSETETTEDQSRYDFTALDQVMPHPVYARQRWVCILNPSETTFETKVKPLLVEAYQMAVSKRDRKSGHK